MTSLRFVFLRRCKWVWPVLGLGLGSLFPACQSSPDVAVVTTIADDKMARILADLSIAEAATARLNGYPKDSLMQIYFRQVMDMHGIAVADYEAQLRAIASDPAQMEALLRDSENLLEDTAEEKTEALK